MTQLSAGESFEVSATRLRMGIGWDKDRGAGIARTGRPDVDLDATALQFTGRQLFDLAFYNNLKTRDGSVEHHGDNQTGSGEGDDEQILVDLSKVHAPVDTIVFLVSSYQGHSLEWVANAYCRLVDEDSDEELARFTLTMSVTDTGAVLALLRRTSDGVGAQRGRRGRADHRADAGAREAQPLPLTRVVAQATTPQSWGLLMSSTSPGWITGQVLWGRPVAPLLSLTQSSWSWKPTPIQ